MNGALLSVALGLALGAKHRVDAGPPPAPPSESATTTPEPEHPLHITADHLTVLTKENRTEWIGHVHVVRPPENGQPPVDIRCQKMNTTASAAVDAGPAKEGESKVDKVFCHGDVIVAQGDRGGTGDEAIFDNVAGVLTVTGRPQARDGASRYSADLLTFYVDRSKLEMSGHVVAVLPSENGGLPSGGPSTAATDGGAPRVAAEGKR